ncbi:hypothetical protein PPTG_23104 [Phytophthora nicotianae INRA-310]|uniref:Uncharacterized protein n=2 Tax=Phytophthora nicotianae TaxID=4792 RepID=W2Q449_PHYN3|nr:hypothetical protein PPTG_23104 [Phytophthora nicotianae INRA-310]ETN07922.1 hypothetical protein PPTG_23104 [Phytophthora nicotianae INRA-310]ETO73171.1 hypothetical protein F444_10862 [Phytophthora nicotianae P1976]
MTKRWQQQWRDDGQVDHFGRSSMRDERAKIRYTPSPQTSNGWPT